MREIKFRGKTHYGKWIYGGIYDNFIVQNASDINRDIVLTVDRVTHVLEDTIGQYTGLKDKNEKEIYVGDIVIVSTYSYEEPLIDTTCVVRYDDEYCLYNFTEIGAKGVYSYSMIEIRNSFKYELEVIGNKYENPELEGEE